MTILQLCKDTLACLPSEAKDLSVSPPSGALISALSNAWTLHTSHCHHGHAKSVTLVLDNHSKGPEALHHFLKDDWDMPEVGISQDLTWQHLEKKLTKSFRLEIPDFGSSNLNQRAPSANGALVGSAISCSFLINGKKPSTPDQQLAHPFSAPPSPSPDRVDMRTHGKVLASDLGLPMDMLNTVATLKTPAKNVSKKPEAHSVLKSVAGFQCDDQHRRRNSTSSTGYLSSQIPIIAGKQSINLKNSGFGEEVGAIKPSSPSNASEDKSTVLGKFSSSALPLGSSQSIGLGQRVKVYCF
ncbi:hypothetical protein PPACK8108_LOCUS23923 [Phakopsora pachyrhizi]|uniref:Uncharacterized protein n=1 Tax=Phakopsora pachyrhizi TaxID=170000 RepID=A0AAV0BNL0_PHAPC|nr:hypothetical protein PPACK8108_LOCUS23923 [Phakopsora pachyrhizi]